MFRTGLVGLLAMAVALATTFNPADAKDKDKDDDRGRGRSEDRSGGNRGGGDASRSGGGGGGSRGADSSQRSSGGSRQIDSPRSREVQPRIQNPDSRSDRQPSFTPDRSRSGGSDRSRIQQPPSNPTSDFSRQGNPDRGRDRTKDPVRIIPDDPGRNTDFSRQGNPDRGRDRTKDPVRIIPDDPGRNPAVSDALKKARERQQVEANRNEPTDRVRGRDTTPSSRDFSGGRDRDADRSRDGVTGGDRGRDNISGKDRTRDNSNLGDLNRDRVRDRDRDAERLRESALGGARVPDNLNRRDRVPDTSHDTFDRSNLSKSRDRDRDDRGDLDGRDRSDSRADSRVTGSKRDEFNRNQFIRDTDRSRNNKERDKQRDDRLTKDARESIERAQAARGKRFDDRDFNDRKGDKYAIPAYGKDFRRGDRIDDDTARKLAKKDWSDKYDRDRITRLTSAPKIQKLNLDRQYHLHDRGDISRQLKLDRHLHDRGGWQHRHIGHVSSQYRNHSYYRPYYGPSWYPRRCWYPTWRPWVSWSWNFYVDPVWDPRPIYCRPVWYEPAPVWTVYRYPVWQPLPVATAGTWVDVPQVQVDAGVDLQLLAVRFVDPGHIDQNLGQRYRVWLRNNSPQDINTPFNVIVMGNNENQPGDNRIEAGQRVPSIAAGETVPVDIRLPLAPNGQPGEPFAFSMVHVLVDSHRELNDVNQANNGAVVDRGEILPVDPAVFAGDENAVTPGDVINIAGEGLGPEPGQVFLTVDGQTVEPEILGWYDLGVQVRVPDVAARADADADVIIVRGDGAATNPLPVQIAAGEIAGQQF